MTENDISYKIRGAIYKVYSALGPGLFESAYEAALAYELRNSGLSIETQVAVPILYGDVKLDAGYRIDILVEKKVIIEIKSIEKIGPVHHKQLTTYLKLTQMKLGILVNFDSDEINKSIFRKVNGL